MFVYYQLDNFYQNHRRYVKSRSNPQLLGTDMTVDELGDCEPIVTNADIERYYSIGGEPLDMDAPAFPCGLVAKSFFNDTYSLYKIETSSVIDETETSDDLEVGRLLTVEETYEEIAIDKTDVSWESDREYRFKNLEGDLKDKLQWIDVEDGKCYLITPDANFVI